MKLLNSLEFKSVAGGECVCHMPNELLAAFKITNNGCANFCCKVKKASSWRNSHWYRSNGHGDCLVATEAPLTTEEELVGETAEIQAVPFKMQVPITDIAQLDSK